MKKKIISDIIFAFWLVLLFIWRNIWINYFKEELETLGWIITIILGIITVFGIIYLLKSSGKIKKWQKKK